MSVIANAFVELWGMFLLLSPFFLLGLFLAGLLHILVSKKQMFLVAGDEGMKGVLLAEIAATPLPLCSCGVAPLAIELKRKGASRPAIIAFLITTPETGIDNILVTFGLMGPFMAIIRPASSYLLGILGGIFAIGLLRDKPPEETLEKDHRHCTHSDGEEHQQHSSKKDPDYVGFKVFFLSFLYFPRRLFFKVAHAPVLYSWYRPKVSCPSRAKAPAPSSKILPLREIFGRIFRYSYGQLADDVLGGLVFGLAITLVILFILPSDLTKYGMEKGILPYFAMLVLGIPLYVCASASTPIAAALVYKGISPGAALVFLLTGPATNVPTLVILARHFGAKFTHIYLWSVLIGGFFLGIACDFVLYLFGWHVVGNISQAPGMFAGTIEWISAFLLIALICWRTWKGNLRAGLHDQLTSLAFIAAKINGLDNSTSWRDHFSTKSYLVRYFIPCLILLYFCWGFYIVPIGGMAYGRVFQKVVWKDLREGLYYIPPPPFGKMDIYHPFVPREISISLRPSKDTKVKQGAVEFFSGDENLVDMKVIFHYTISNPYKYFYQINNPEGVLLDYLSMSTRDASATRGILNMMTKDREQFQQAIKDYLLSFIKQPAQERKFKDLGVKVVAINVVEMTPPQEALYAFRDVVSAREDRETSNLKALAILTEIIMRTRGEGSIEIDRAHAFAFSEKAKATGKNANLIARASAVASHRNLLENLLWIQTSERALSKQELFLLPPGNPPQTFKLWKSTSTSFQEESTVDHQEEKKKKQNTNKKNQKTEGSEKTENKEENSNVQSK